MNMKRAAFLVAAALACMLSAGGPEWMASGRPKGYCSCSCSLIRNCTTDADCGSGRCLQGPTCCFGSW